MRNVTRQAASGFTLIELLVVVIILSVLAAIVVPMFRGSLDGARLSALDTELGAIRSAISQYTLEHGHAPGAVPSVGICAVGTNTDTATPGAAAFVAHMTQYTTNSGIACSESDASSGGSIIFGPYLRQIPENPMTNDNTVVAIQTGSEVLDVTGSDTEGGWFYDFKVGAIAADQPKYADR